MSDLSTIVDNLAAKVEATLSGYVRVANPYVVERNDQLALARGYGVGIGAGRPQNLYLGGKRAWERTFNVLLINLVTASPTDASGNATGEKALIEDCRSLARALELDQTLSGVCTKIDYLGDSGVTLSESEIHKYISVSIDFAILYEEAL